MATTIFRYVHVRVIEATGLPAKDITTGSSDPYCKIRLTFKKTNKTADTKKRKTKVKKKSRAPFWNENFTFQVRRQDLAEGHLSFVVADHDTLARNDEIGVLHIPLKDIIKVKNVDSWMKIHHSETDEPAGQLKIKVVVDDKPDGELNSRANLLRRTSLLHMTEPDDDVDVDPDSPHAGLVGPDGDTDEKEPVPPPKRKREKDTHRINVFVGSFNAGNVPPPKDFSPWIPPLDQLDGGYELVVIGMQECGYDPGKFKRQQREKGKHAYCTTTIRELPPDAVDKDGKPMDKAEIAKINEQRRKEKGGMHFFRALGDHLGPNYVEVKYVNMGEIRLAVFCHKRVRENITEVREGHEATGLMHVYTNKGGVACSMVYLGTSLCFVNSHLAAHQGDGFWQKRDEDYREICSRDGLKIGYEKMTLLSQFNHLFWVGDLNYRIRYGDGADTKSPDADTFHEVVDLIKAREYDQLIPLDQLTQSMTRERAFWGFKEGDLRFPPTFKVERGKPLQYQSKRLPAWCDRILWKSSPGEILKQTSYGCAPEILSSDHKPVYATFHVTIKNRVNSWDDALGTAMLHFKSVKATNLKSADVVSGLSDPYIHWPRQKLLERYQDTKAIKNNLNPEWKDKHVKPLALVRNGKTFLANSLLFVQVKDKDTFSKDDIIGNGYIPLSAAVAGAGTFVEFEVALEDSGLPAGTLRGLIRLTWEDRQDKT